MIIQDGLRRMYEEQEDVYYYLTLLNENHRAAGHAGGRGGGDPQGALPLPQGRATRPKAPRVQLLGSGAIFHEVAGRRRAPARRLGRRVRPLERPQLHRAGARRERRGPREPASPRGEAAPVLRGGEALPRPKGPVVAATDYVRAYAEQIRAFVPRRYLVLGTDGFGRSDTREKLRSFFEVDRFHVVVAALKALADDGALPAARAAEAMRKYGIDGSRPAPWTV